MAFQIVKAVERRQRSLRALIALLSVLSAPAGESAAQPARWMVSAVPASGLACLLGIPVRRVAVVACRARCLPIPWQLDERGSDGDLVFDGGDLASADDPPGIVDANDEVVFMPADAGRAAAADELPAATCRLPLRVRAPDEPDRWLYAVAYDGDAPRSVSSYVRYDAQTDTLTGAGIVLGFRDRIPQYLAVPGPDGSATNLLDRLKVRASARFLGLIPVRRDEGDLEPAAVGWRVGPVRIVRRQRQRIRVGWGIKSPRFTIDTYFHRTSATMPVIFRLNFPPTYFFSAIAVETVLDFRDLRDWTIHTPALATPVDVAALSEHDLRALNNGAADWFALIGPQVQLVQFLELSSSLAPLDTRMAFRATTSARPPESVPGEMPGVGYTLHGWGAIDRGVHAFAAVTYLLPRDQDLAAFLRARAHPPSVEVLPPGPDAE